MVKEKQIDYSTDEISLKEILLKVQHWWKYLLSKWILILIFGLTGGLLGFLYANSKATVYVATTTFVLEDEKSNGGLGSLTGLASMAGVDLGSSGGGIFQGDNILELYRSRKMIEKTLLTKTIIEGKKDLLINRYIKFNKLRDVWSRTGILKFANFEKLEEHKGSFACRVQDSLLGTIVLDINQNYLNVSKPNKKTNILSAQVKSRDEEFSKALNDQIVKNVNDFYVQTKSKKSLNNILILQQKVDSIRAIMNMSIYSAAIITDETPNINPTRQTQRIVPQQRAQFSAEANKLILIELEKNLELSKIGLRKEQPLIQIVDQPVFPLDKERFSRSKGVLIGGVLAGLIICIFLILKRFFQTILS